MSRFDIGPAILMVPDHGGRELQATACDGESDESWGLPAAVAAPHGLLMEVAYQRWYGADALVALSRGESDPPCDRHLHGERLSMKAGKDGVEQVVADLFQWNPTESPMGCGSASEATPMGLRGVPESLVA